MKILHICNYAPEKISGLAIAVLKLANSQMHHPAIKDVWVLNLGRRNKNDAVSTGDSSATVMADVNASASELIECAHLVHFHGVYQLAYRSLGKECIQLQTPYIVCPHSSLMRAAMHTSWIKKTLSNWLWFDPFVRNATARHFLTPEEASNSRFGDLPCFIAGNAIEIPSQYSSASASPLKLCFIGRFDIRHKGLDILVQGVALAQNELRSGNVSIQLYGPDHDGGKEQLARQIQQLNVSDLVTIHDAVAGDQKVTAFTDCSVFVHTSRYEGQPQAVLEAWSYGRAALVTPGTNVVSAIRDHELGWVMEESPQGFTQSIKAILADRNEIVRRGLLARKYAESHLTQSYATEQVIKGYSQVLGL